MMMMAIAPVTTGRARRRDAQLRRDALLEAAVECFAEHGYHVPLEEIAERAGVGRATLYRNFKDRMALVYAIFEREVDRLHVDLDPKEPIREAMTRLALRSVAAHSLFARLATDLARESDAFAAFQTLAARFAAVIEPSAAAAQARGEIKRNVGGQQLALALRMVSGLLRPSMSEQEMLAVTGEAIDLLMLGMKRR